MRKDWSFVIIFGHRSCGLPECIKAVLSANATNITSLDWWSAINIFRKEFDYFHIPYFSIMYLSYYFVLYVLPLYISQITVSNEGDEAIQAVTRNDDEIRTVANDGKAIKKWCECKVCNKPFKWSSDLERHGLKHRNERPFKCHVCNKTFKEFRVLKIHHLTHGNGRKFKCAMCDKAFKQRRYLKRHMKAHKDIEKTLKCDVCGKAFEYSSHAHIDAWKRAAIGM
ncbi:unnamed protein product [Cercopithifilaria johnstoni]|uniref:C2H2-type domain-containing protein n=1 Tax=Cercopithifilaria johnstoni TaxID=2874296 RepID=A0A8J2LZM4_9BILA|nr:unnamed protein product [Cercopithifilaria johnstoni]